MATILRSRIGIIALAATALAFAPPARPASEAAELNQKGLQHLRAARFVEAEAVFREVNKAEERNAIYTQNLAVALAEQGKYDEAIPLFRAALDMRGTYSVIHRGLGNALFAKEQLKEAMEQYQKALAINAAEQVQQRIIETAFITGETEKWIATFEKDIKDTQPEGKDGVNKVFFREQAILLALSLQGKYDEEIARAGKDLEAIKGVATQSGGYVIPIITPFFFFIRSVPKTSLNLNPIIANLYALRGAAYMRKGMLDEAIADFKAGLDAHQESFSGMQLGIALLEKGDLKEGLYQLRKFVEIRPSIKQAWIYYAIALKLNGEQQAGEEQLKRFDAVKASLNPGLKSNFEVLESLAWADLVWDRREDAFKRFSQVAEWCPQCGRSQRSLAELYLKAGDKLRAEEYAGKALALIPGDPGTQKLAAALGIAAPKPDAATSKPD